MARISPLEIRIRWELVPEELPQSNVGAFQWVLEPDGEIEFSPTCQECGSHNVRTDIERINEKRQR